MIAKAFFLRRLILWPCGVSLIYGLCLVFLVSCTAPAESDGELGDRPIRVVTTTTMVRDMVEAIGGERIEVDNLMGPGVDPHLYRSTVMDLRRLDRADGVFYVGLRFEELMEDVLERQKQSGRKVFALTETLPPDRLLEADEGAGIVDPHVWFDVYLWSYSVDAVLAGLIELDPDHRAYFEERADAHRASLISLHQWALEVAEELAPAKRVLVTSHDAYSYFGRAYGFQVVGLMGISTASEAGLADITRLIDFIRERNLLAIFVESSVSPRAIERVSRDSGARIGGELFSDALGPPGDERLGFDVGTYDGMIRYNMTTIVEALREEQP
jgi:manganese/zinc/iron transport system substrate-binding protein